MGYPVPSNSPRINVSGRTIAVAANAWVINVVSGVPVIR